MKSKVEIKQKNWEGVLVVILLMLIFLVLVPYVYKIIYNAHLSGAISSCEGLVTAVKTAYTKGNLMDVIDLPFEIKYENENYTTFSNGKKVRMEEIKVDGQVPSSGSVIINKDGEVEIRDLQFGKIICNKDAKNSETTCS